LANAKPPLPASGEGIKGSQRRAGVSPVEATGVWGKSTWNKRLNVIVDTYGRNAAHQRWVLGTGEWGLRTGDWGLATVISYQLSVTKYPQYQFSVIKYHAGTVHCGWYC